MSSLFGRDIALQLKQGLAADINTTATKNSAQTGEPHYATDTEQLYIFNGTENVAVGGLSIGDSIGGATEGSIFFAGDSGVLFQNNSKLFWDELNERLGLGTTSPGVCLHIKNTGNATILAETNAGRIMSFGSLDASPFTHLGTLSSHTFSFVTNGARVVRIGLSSGMSVGRVYADNDNPPDDGLIIEGDVGIGNINPQSALHVTDDIRWKDDFVLTAVNNGASPVIKRTVFGSMGLRLMAFGNAGEEAVSLAIDSIGTVGSTNREYSIFGFQPTPDAFEWFTSKAGSGILRDINIYADGVRGQLHLDTDGNVGIGNTDPATKLDVSGATTQRELSADPADPAEGSSVTWMSDGTGSGDDGDIMMKITAGAVTKTVTLVDFSAV